MWIDISRMKKKDSAPQEVVLRGPVDPPKMVPPVVFPGPVDVNIVLENRDGELHMCGQAATRVTWTCTRCLETYQTEETLCLQEILYPEDAPAQDIDFRFTYSGNQLELDEIIGQALILSAGMRSVCSRDCCGICPVCGGNRNRQTCDCEENATDPRMEILKTLRREY